MAILSRNIPISPIMRSRLTVIVPTIGRPEYLGLTLESLRRQTVTDFDVLVSDNFAEPPVSASFVDDQLGVIPHMLVRRTHRLELVQHFNQCLLEAKGEWVMFISDDDLVSTDYIELFLRTIDTAQSVSMIVSRQIVIDENVRVLPRIYSPSETVRVPGLEFVRQCQAGKFPDIRTVISLCARRQDLLADGGFPDYPQGAHVDNLVWMRLALKGDTVCLPGTLFYRIYGASTGLSIPPAKLYVASQEFESDLLKLFAQSVEGREITTHWQKGNTRLILVRWRQALRLLSPRTWGLSILCKVLIRQLQVLHSSEAINCRTNT